MEEREELYQERVNAFMVDLREAKKEASQIVAYRVTAFLLGALLSWFLFEVHILAGFGGVILTLGTFLFLVKKHEDVRVLIRYLEVIIDLNKAEIAALKGDFSHFAGGGEYLEDDHAYAHDLDMFGKGSIYQWINRSTTVDGMSLLASELASASMPPEGISAKQEGIEELAERFEWRQDFHAFGKVYESEVGEKEQIRMWLDSRSDFTKSWWVKLSKIIFPITSFGAIVAFALGAITFLPMLGILTIPLLITSLRIKETNKQHALATTYQSAMEQHGKLLEMIEGEDYASEYLANRMSSIEVEGRGAGASLQRLTSIVNALDNRSNPFVGLGLNSLLMWDFYSMTRLEKWLDQHGPKLEGWIDLVAEFDALSSYAHVAWNNPGFCWPDVSDDTVFHAVKLGHPLISPEKRVDNDFGINDQGEFVIITGANMAGKSTFLRSVGVNLVLARVGAPVCAEEMRFKPLKIFTSMRTTDSLRENESYFYTELKRLSQIVELQEQGEELFIILDEILKGTNSKDKASGSRKFVEKLVKMRSTGIIATHDLSLCELAGTMPTVRNQCFEVEFGKDDLVFDYKLRDGVCQNMNATWLMEKMGVVGEKSVSGSVVAG